MIRSLFFSVVLGVVLTLTAHVLRCVCAMCLDVRVADAETGVTATRCHSVLLLADGVRWSANVGADGR